MAIKSVFRGGMAKGKNYYRTPASAPSKNWMEKNEDWTDFKGDKMENFADTSVFNAGVKEKNTKTNKITIVKNQKLAQHKIFF